MAYDEEKARMLKEIGHYREQLRRIKNSHLGEATADPLSLQAAIRVMKHTARLALEKYAGNNP